MTIGMYRVRVASSGWSGGPGLNTWYFRNEGGGGEVSLEQAEDAAELVRTALTGAVGMYPNATTLQVSADVDVLRPEDGELAVSYHVATQAPVTGSGGTTYGPLPAMLCAIYTTDAVVNGKRVKGRAFFGPLKPANDTNGTPDSAILVSATNLAAYTTLGTGTVPQQVIWHRPGPAGAGSMHPVTGSFVRDKWAVLRSRRD